MARANANDTPIAPDHGRIAAVQALIGLAHRQIDAGLSRAANIDTQALGLIGLDAALIAVTCSSESTAASTWATATKGP